MPRPRKVVGNLGQVIVGRSVPGPVPGANAPSDRLPDKPQAFHRVRFRHIVRRRRQRCPQVGRRRDQLIPASYHRRRDFGPCVEERVAGQCVAIGQEVADRAAVRPRHRYSPPRPARRRAPLDRTAAMVHPRHRSGATTAQPTQEAPLGCPRMVWAHPAGRGEATGPVPRPLQNRFPMRVVNAMTGHRLRRPASIPAQLRVEVSARHLPPFQ
jgi:hypothetical protein